MIDYISEGQLSIEEFKTPFEASLLPDNRWVELGKIVPWDRFASIYMSVMSSDTGRPGLSPRLVLGALIIKHKEKLDDRGVIAAIQENIYMQYFVGLKGYDPRPVFDPSLFVEIRKRVGASTFDKLNTDLIRAASSAEGKKRASGNQGGNDGPPPNKGKLKMDATVADQYITYPTDSKLLNASRKQTEKMIDGLYGLNGKEGTKPRTYRRTLDTAFLDYSKKKRKARADHRKINRKLLEALNRNIGHINALLDIFLAKGRPFPLSRREQKMFWVVQTVYQQQKQMYDKNSNRCDHRIVSIFQPHVRPMVRGKDKAKVEFGSKLGASLDNGFARIDTLSWDAYNESGDLVLQVENYRELHGHWPELVQADKIYAARANRAYLKERGIRITAPPLGRKSKALQQESHYKRRKRKKEATERNHIEGKFGQGKNGYGLNKIRARLRDTSESWVAAIFFVMNLVHYRKNVFSWLCCTIKTVMDCPADHLKDFLGIISSMATIPNQNERKSLTKVAL